MKSNVGKGRGAGESATLDFTVDSPFPLRRSSDTPEISQSWDFLPLGSSLTAKFRKLELGIAEQIQGLVGLSSTGRLRVGVVVCALPDVLVDCMSWPLTSGSLADCPLFQHSKVIPHSFAIIQHFLDTGALVLPPSSPGSWASHNVVVLSSDDWIVECTLHVLEAVSPDLVEVMESDASYFAEVAG